ncbi:MAG TPA: discoidin domain-containing protein [Longimicrobium sp.]|nr:discoidin domain-containing protein [Longimicrobium sp.]
MWTRAEKIAFGSLLLGLLSCVLAVAIPEVRLLIGFDTPPQHFAGPTADPLPPAPAGPEKQEAPPSRGIATSPAPGSRPSARLPSGQPLLVASATASSVLPPSRVARYDAEMLMDGDGSTPWVENAPGYGVGEWVELQLGVVRTVTHLQLRNGYNKGARFRENGRIRSITATFSTGDTRTFFLRDDASEQTITFEPLPIPTSFIRLTINSVYEGTRWEDTALGDVAVLGY